MGTRLPDRQAPRHEVGRCAVVAESRDRQIRNDDVVARVLEPGSASLDEEFSFTWL